MLRSANFMVSTIFGAKPPNGVTPITDERVRGRLGELFLKGSKEERRAERRASPLSAYLDLPASLRHAGS